MNNLQTAGLTPLFAVDIWHSVVVIVFFAVWVIGAVARGLGQAQEQQNARPVPRPQPPRDKPQASPQELEQFLREFGGQPTASAAQKRPEKRKPVREQAPQPVPQQQAVSQRHLHSQLETRRTTVMQSRLEDSHLQAHSAAEELTRLEAVAAADGKRFTRQRGVNRTLGGLLTRQQLGRAFILGQVLQPPPSLGGPANDPFASPAAH